jgi:alpha-glucosidase
MVPIPPELEQDPFGLRVPGLGRDPYRTPMQWNAGPNAGFSAPGTPRLWLPLAADYRKVNVERELADPTSILNLYRRLLAYRKSSPALQWGDYQALEDVPDGCYVYMREANGHRTLIALNFSHEEQQIALRAMGTGKIAISTHLDRAGAVDLAELALHGDEGVIVEME